MDSKPGKERKQHLHQRGERKSSKSLSFSPQESSPQRDSPSTSNALPKSKFTGKKPEDTQSMGDRTTEKASIKGRITHKIKKGSPKSHKDLTATAETSKSKARRTGLLPLDVERICLGNDLSRVDPDISELIFSESLIEEIAERQCFEYAEGGDKTHRIVPLDGSRQEELEKCSKSMLRRLKKNTKRIIKEKYDCHKEWKKLKKEVKELKRIEDDQKVYILKYLDSPLSEEDDMYTKRGLLDFYWHIIQTLLITIIAMSMMDSEMYFFSNQTVSLFFDEITVLSSNFTLNDTGNSPGFKQKRTLRDSKTVADFWAFSETSLLNLLYCDFFNSYRDPLTHTPEDDKTHVYANQILGVARIRQVRVEKTSCEIHPYMERFFSDCYAYYSIYTECTEPIRKDMKGSVTETAWKYTEMTDLKGPAYFGEMAWYGGGGYYLDLTRDKETAAKMLQELRENDWVSKATRAVFIDFTIYNANVNLFCFCKIVVEMPPAGGIVATPDFTALKLIRYLSALDFFVLALEFIYLLLIVYLTYREIYKIYLKKSFYFLNMWNYLEMTILLLSYIYIGLNIGRYFWVKHVIRKLEDQYYEYTELASVKHLHLCLNNIIASTVFFSWVRLFSGFNFTTNMVRFQKTLERGLVNMLMFIPMFLIMILAFSMLAYLLFGYQVKEYSSIWKAFFTLLQTFLGEFNSTYILETNIVVGPIFYALFIFFEFFVLVNVFIAIISEAYVSVMSETFANTPEYGNYLRRGFVNFFTCCQPRVKNEKLNASLRKKFLFQEIQGALKRAGFSDKELKLFLHKYDINYMNFLDEKTRSKIRSDLKLEEFEINETSEQYQIDVLKRKYENLRSRLEILDIKLQPIIDKVDIILHRL